MKQHGDFLSGECTHTPCDRQTVVGRFIFFLFSPPKKYYSDETRAKCCACGTPIDLPDEYFTGIRSILYFVFSIPYHAILTVMFFYDESLFANFSLRTGLALLVVFFLPNVMERIANSLVLSKYMWRNADSNYENNESIRKNTTHRLRRSSHSTLSQLILLAQVFDLRLVYFLLFAAVLSLIGAIATKNKKGNIICTIAIIYVAFIFVFEKHIMGGALLLNELIPAFFILGLYIPAE